MRYFDIIFLIVNYSGSLPQLFLNSNFGRTQGLMVAILAIMFSKLFEQQHLDKVKAFGSVDTAIYLYTAKKLAMTNKFKGVINCYNDTSDFQMFMLMLVLFLYLIYIEMLVRFFVFCNVILFLWKKYLNIYWSLNLPQYKQRHYVYHNSLYTLDSCS